MNRHDHLDFEVVTREVVRQAGIRPFGLRTARAARAAVPAAECSFIHPHSGPCQPREAGDGADGGSRGLLVR